MQNSGEIKMSMSKRDMFRQRILDAKPDEKIILEDLGHIFQSLIFSSDCDGNGLPLDSYHIAGCEYSLKYTGMIGYWNDYYPYASLQSVKRSFIKKWGKRDCFIHLSQEHETAITQLCCEHDDMRKKICEAHNRINEIHLAISNMIRVDNKNLVVRREEGMSIE